jgi:DNA-directed RNA polymerase specialized sigma subunit
LRSLSLKLARDKEAIEEFLYSPIDGSILQKLKKGASLLEAPNIHRTKKEENLRQMFENITDIKERNKKIVKAYKKGYSQYMIAKVLGVSQPAVSGVIRRSR